MAESSDHPQVRYEVAEEMLAMLRTITRRRLQHARQADPVDQAAVTTLTADLERYIALRRGLHRLTDHEVEQLITTYAPIARQAAADDQ